MHWSKEYTPGESFKQREIAKFFADIVIGNHAHMVQSIERIQDTLVFYALGNFISIQTYPERRVGMLASFSIEKGNGKIRISDLTYELVYTGYVDREEHIRIYPFF